MHVNNTYIVHVDGKNARLYDTDCGWFVEDFHFVSGTPLGLRFIESDKADALIELTIKNLESKA